MAKEKKENPNKIGIAKFWGWNARGVSVGCVTIIYGTYFMLFCTDVLQVSSAVVGTLLLVSKIFDGVTDLIAGYLVDNTHTKLGKARPYEFAILGVWSLSWLLFSCPVQWSDTMKYVFIFIMYTLINSVFVTLLNVNQSTYMTRAFPNQMVMVKLNSYGGIVVTIGCAVVSMTFPMLVASMGSTAAGWSQIMAIYCIPLAVIGMLRFFLVPEVIDVDGGSQEKMKVSEVIQVITKNKYVYFVLGAYLCYNIVTSMSFSSYYFTYVVGDVSMLTMVSAMTMPLMIVMFIFPKMMQKMRLSRLVMLGAAFGAVGYFLNFIAGGNIILLMVAGLCYGFGGLPIAYVGGMMLLDCGEYNTFIGLPRSLGTVSSFQSFASKVGQGIGSWLLGVLLAVGGYTASAETQSAGALMMIRCGYSIIPGLLFVAIFVILYFYDLEKKLPELRAAKAALDAAAGQAQ